MRDREGLALVTTVLMILLLAAMASGIISLIMEEGTLVENRIELARAENIADAAEGFAVNKMSEPSGWENWSGVEDRRFAGGAFGVEVVNVSSDEKELRCTGEFGRSAAIREKFVRQGPLAAEGNMGAYVSDNPLLMSAADFALVTTRFDNPSSVSQGGGQGDRVYLRVSGVELQPDGTNKIQFERLDGSTSSPDPWKEGEEAFEHDAANNWLEAAFRLPEENNNGKEWKNCFVNLKVEIETASASGLDYVSDSRRERADNNLICNIKNNTGEALVLTAMIVNWDQPRAYYGWIRIKVLDGGPDYGLVWWWILDGHRAASGEKVVFNLGRAVSIPAGATFELWIGNFRSGRTGLGWPRDMDDTSFAITFFAAETEYPETTVPVAGEPARVSSFKLWQAISIGTPQPVVRFFQSSSAREEEGMGLRRWKLSPGQSYYLRVWTGRLSGALKSDEGKLKLLDLLGGEDYCHCNAFSEAGEGRYDAELSIPEPGESLPKGWARIPLAGWDYILRVEMEDPQGRRFRYASAVRIEE